MMSSIESIEQDITHYRRDLDRWLMNAYTGMEEQKYCGEMDASYPKWADIESITSSIFDNRLVQQLNRSSLDAMLFFIARSDELGRIIAWLAPKKGTPFSWCGDLLYPDFLFLCEQALIRDEDYSDYQLAACFQKCESLDGCAISILERFFNRNDSYTRRLALDVLGYFTLPQAVDLAIKLWQTDDCEFAKLSCLYTLKRFANDRELFDTYLREYQNLFDVTAKNYRQSHIQQLTSSDIT
jgi:hypothetical protein